MLLTHCNKMVLSKREINLFMKLLEQCSFMLIYLNILGQRLFLQLVLLNIVFSVIEDLILPLMKSLSKGNLMSNFSMFLVADVFSWIWKTIFQSFKRRQMKEYFLDILKTLWHIWRIEETFKLKFDDYYAKRLEHEFPHKPILSNFNEDYDQMLTFDTNFDALFWYSKERNWWWG